MAEKAFWKADATELCMSGHGREGWCCIAMLHMDYIPPCSAGADQPALPLSEVIRSRVCASLLKNLSQCCAHADSDSN